MNIDQIISDSLVGKRLALYKISWIEYPKNKKHDDIWALEWRLDTNIGEYNFKHIPRGVHWLGVKWDKKSKESMKIEPFDFEIKSVEITECEEWSKSMDACFELVGFPEKTFNCSTYADLELK